MNISNPACSTLGNFLRIAVTVMVFSSAFFPSVSQARETARQFLSHCELLEQVPATMDKNEARFLAGYCIGVIQGISDGAVFTAAFYRGAKKLEETKNIFCIPDKISKSTIAKTLVNYGTKHPELLDGPDIQFIMAALHEEYPCI